MEVILLEKVANLGILGDKVKVKAGYGRNFLVPFGKAVPATKANVEAFEARRAELEAAAAGKLAEAQKRAEQLSEIELTITAKAGDEVIWLMPSLLLALKLPRAKYVCLLAQSVLSVNSTSLCSCTPT